MSAAVAEIAGMPAENTNIPAHELQINDHIEAQMVRTDTEAYIGETVTGTIVSLPERTVEKHTERLVGSVLVQTELGAKTNTTTVLPHSNFHITVPGKYRPQLVPVRYQFAKLDA